MEENQKKKFVCKFCNRRFPCGKSLGGHIRTHMNENHSTREEGEEKARVSVLKFSSFNGVKKTQKDSGSEAAGQSGYGLRENPKKTWRFVDSSSALRQEKVCKECGKGFQSLKALCGHMACHSDKEKQLINNNNNLEEEEEEEEEEEHSETSEKQKLVMDTHSDTETSAPRQTKISKRIKYKTLDVYSSLGNSSSSVSGIEQEQQEVAISLMLLSRDSGTGHKGGLNSIAESSDNNSVVLEAKSSSTDMVKKAKDGVVKSAEISVSDNSDSGYFRNGPKKIESDMSVDGSIRNIGFKKIEVESGSGFCRTQRVQSELGKNLLNEEGEEEEDGDDDNDNDEVAAGHNQVDRGSSSKYELRKRTGNGFYRPQIGSSFKKATNCYSSDVEFCRNSSQKRNRYECLTCNKIFHSHRALGGHRASHTKTNGCCESVYESGENSIETEDSPVQTPATGKSTTKQHFSGNVERKPAIKKGKEHECPICLRVFRSGQALGGHKRSHFVGGFEDKTMVIRQETPDTRISGLFDLNLPAPMEQEANGHVGFVAW